MRFLVCFAIAVTFAPRLAVQAQSFPQGDAKTYLTASPAVAAEQPLRRLALADASTPEARRNRALALFVLGTGESNRGDIESARADLAGAAADAYVGDAAVSTLVAALFRAGDYAGVLQTLELHPLAKTDPFHADAAMTAARSAAEIQQWPAVLPWCAELPATPPTLLLRAQAYEGIGEARSAANVYRTLVYEHPAAPEAAPARAAWQRLLPQFPDLAATATLLARQAEAWSSAGHNSDAARTWAEAIAALAATPAAATSGGDRLYSWQAEEARASLAAGDRVHAEQIAAELLPSPQRVQALEIEFELARASHRQSEMDTLLATLRREFSTSAWYERALRAAGNDALVQGDLVHAQSYYDSVAQLFPASGPAGPAAWQAAFIAYRLHSPDTGARMEAYLVHFPHGDDAADALYWLGRWNESQEKLQQAERCYRAAAGHFPGAYFGLQARERLGTLPAAAADVDAPPLPEFLRPFVETSPAPEAAHVPAAQQSAVDRAAWLKEGWLLDPAAAILDEAFHQLPTGEASLSLARRLADLDGDRGDWHAGIDAMERSVPDALRLQGSQLSSTDWKRLYPYAYADSIAEAARIERLSPAFLLAVIRHESGFDPESVSPTLARGLMQLELPTAREEMPHLPAAWRALAPPGPLQPESLFQPQLSIALGAADLRALLNQFGNPVFALAGYDAGPGRVTAWRRQIPADDLNEFIESIPFQETRIYVQSVLRNQWRYVQIYGPAASTLASPTPK